MKRTALTARWVVGHVDGSHRLFRNGTVVVEGTQVLFAGHGFDGEVAETIDFGDAMIGPGFVDLDALSDLDTTVLGYDNHPPELKGRVWPQSYMQAGPREMYTPEELAWQKRYAFTRLIRNGITTALPIASLFYRAWGETAAEFDAAADAAAELGLRVYLGPAYRSGNLVVGTNRKIGFHYDEARGFAGLDDAARFIDRHENTHGGLVRTMLAPTGSRPARPSFCAAAGRWRVIAMCRSGCIAVSRGWNTIWSCSSMAKARWSCCATPNSLPPARSCRMGCFCRASMASPMRPPISTS